MEDEDRNAGVLVRQVQPDTAVVSDAEPKRRRRRRKQAETENDNGDE